MEEKIIEFIESISKNEIFITADSKNPDNFFKHSHIGGCPDVPEGFEWPCFSFDGEKIPLSFLAQFNLEELRLYDKDGLLPDDGMLLFFFANNTGNGSDKKDYDYFRVLYLEDSDNLLTAEYPENADSEDRIPLFSVSFKSQCSYPDYENLLTGGNKNAATHIPKELDPLSYESAVSSLGYEIDCDEYRIKLLGYPDTVQRPMEPDIANIYNSLFPDGNTHESSEWTLLFEMGTLESNEFELMFEDCGHLYFWIRKEDLLNRNFSRCWFIVQGC